MTKIEFLKVWHEETSAFFGLIRCAGDFKRMAQIIEKYETILDNLHIQRYKDFADEQGLTGAQRKVFFSMLGVLE